MENVASRDGTRIAYERKGEGEPVILVDGAFCSRRFGPMDRLSSLLSERFTVYIYDRRGRGDSGDTAPYAIEREVEDLAALIEVAGGKASLFGMSSGAILCLHAAANGQPLRKLALYEPPYMQIGVKDQPTRDDMASPLPERHNEQTLQLKELASSGRRADAVGYFMTKIMGMPETVFQGMRQAPSFPAMETVAHTLAYDVAISSDRSLAGKLAQITTPTLVIGGENSTPPMLEAVTTIAGAIPEAQHLLLAGQSHDVNLDVLAPVLIDFIG